MDNASIRFSNSKCINFELDPTTKKVTITAVLDDTIVAGAVTLKAIKAAKMENK